MKVRFFIAWYDLWIGAYIDTDKKTVYICPTFCCVFAVEWGEPNESDAE